MLRLGLLALLTLALSACADDGGFPADEAETLCRLRFDQAEEGNLSCVERPEFLDDCQQCFMDCKDCVAEFNVCPPIITFCE